MNSLPSSFDSMYRQIPVTQQNISPTLSSFLRQQGISSSMDQNRINTMINQVQNNQTTQKKASFEEGFVKRAQEYGVTLVKAENLYKFVKNSEFGKTIGK